MTRRKLPGRLIEPDPTDVLPLIAGRCAGCDDPLAVLREIAADVWRCRVCCDVANVPHPGAWSGPGVPRDDAERWVRWRGRRLMDIGLDLVALANVLTEHGVPNAAALVGAAARIIMHAIRERSQIC